MMTRKTIIKFLSIINIVLLIIFSLKDNLFYSNLSRIANSEDYLYFIFLFISLLFGINLYLYIKDINSKVAYIGLISLLVGSITPYNYLDSNALTSNIHIIGGFLSILLILVYEIYIIVYLKSINNNAYKLVFYSLLIIGFITIYLYGKYGFMNSLNELIYLVFVQISLMFI